MIRSAGEATVSRKTIAAVPALIACAAVFRRMRRPDLRVAISTTSRAKAVRSASSPGGTSITPASTAISDAESSTFDAMRIGRNESSTVSAQR